MKSASKKRAPSIVNLTVNRRYLTEREVERLMNRARKHSRHGHRDATMILVAYRHACEPRRSATCNGSRSSYPKAACTFTGSRTALPACTQSGVTKCGRCASYAATTPKTPTSSFPSAAGQSVPSAFTASSCAWARLPRCRSRSTHTCSPCLWVPARQRWARHTGLQHYLGHKNIQHTVRYTEMAPDRFKDFWRG